MFRFPSKQRIFDIDGTRVGGQPGELPTVLIGSIFYENHNIVENAQKGLFKKEEAETLINKALSLSDETGNPTIVDIVGDTAEALINYIDFVSSICDSPFLIDGSNADVRIKATEYAAEVGLLSKSIYNTLQDQSRNEEKEVIKNCGIQSCVLLAVNSRDPTVRGRLKIAKHLVQEAQKLNIEKILIDTGVLDIPDVGVASKTIYEIKKELGFPAGCAPANTIDLWARLREKGREIFRVCDGFGNAMTSILGANWVMYGPIERAQYIYPVVAFSDAVIAYTMREEGIRPLTKKHPLYMIF